MQQPPAFQRSPNPQVHLRDLDPGDRIKVTGGDIAEVTMNPRDGLWVLVRRVEAPSDGPDALGEEEMVYFEDVQELISPAQE